MKDNRNYPRELKLRTLATLARLGGNVTRTSKETGISYQTIKKWQEDTEFTASEINLAMRDLYEEEQNILKDLFRHAARRAHVVLNTETNLRHITEFMGKLKELELQEVITGELNAKPAKKTSTLSKDAPTANSLPDFFN